MIDHLNGEYTAKASHMLQSISDRLSFLKFSSPNEFLATIVLILMSLSIFLLVAIAFWKDLKPIFNM